MNGPPPLVDSRLPVLFDPNTGNFVISLAKPNQSLVPGAPAYVPAAQFSGKTLEQAQAKYMSYLEANRVAEQKRQRNLRAAVAQARKNATEANAQAAKIHKAQANALKAKKEAKNLIAKHNKTAKNMDKAAKDKRNTLRRSCGWSKGIFGWSKPKHPSNNPNCQNVN